MLASRLTPVETNTGVVARALQSLADNDYPCSDLIEDSIAKYSDDPFRASQLLEIAARASQDDNEKKRLQHERVRVFEKAADRSSGLLRVSYLEEARTIARDAGLAEEVRRLTTLIERTDTDRDMHTFTQNIEIDPDELRSWVDAVVGEDSLLDALLRLGATTPIGDPESTRATVDEIASKLLFRSLVTTLQFGPENSMIRVPPGDQLHSEIDRGRYDALAIEMFASTCGKMVLDSLHDKYSPQEQDLAGCFACDAVPPEIARRIAVSYGRWADTDYTSAVSVIALTLELIVRRVCRQAGIHVTTTRRSNPPIPEVRPLGELIRELEPLIGRTATRYLEASLVDPWSLNLRNRLAHVLVEELTETHYLVLLHLACALRYIAEALPAEGT